MSSRKTESVLTASAFLALLLTWNTISAGIRPEETDTSIIVQVLPFKTENPDSNTEKISITAERKIVEHLYFLGLLPASPLTSFNMNIRSDYIITGAVSGSGSNIRVSLSLSGKEGATAATGFIQGDPVFFSRIRNVIGETALNCLKFNPSTPPPVDSNKYVAASGNAYALYLLGKRELLANRIDRSLDLLVEALSHDSLFAEAYWMISDLYNRKHHKDSAVIWKNRALSIDPEQLQNPLFDNHAEKENLLPQLLKISKETEFKRVYKGLYYKNISIEKNHLSSAVWIIDTDSLNIDIELTKKEGGCRIEEFIGSNTLLAVNGGFFDMNRQYSVSPSGLIVKQSRILNPVTGKGGSGVFAIRNKKACILWSKEITDTGPFDLALQCGPVLVEMEGIPGIHGNDYRRMNRSAVGVLKDGRVILAVAAGDRGRGLSLYQFAEFLRVPADSGGIGCSAALNLDGGSSTQAWFECEGYKYHIDGLWKVHNSLVVRRKKT